MDLFKQALQLAPDSVRVRRSLRKTQWALIPREAAIPKLQNLKLLKLRAQLKIDQTRQDWDAVLKRCEEALEIAPHDAELNFVSGEACLELGYQQTARFAFAAALELEPDNRVFLRKSATMAESDGKFSKALQYWQRIQKLTPHDSAVETKIAQLMAISFVDDETRNRQRKRTPLPPDDRDTMVDEGDTAVAEAIQRLKRQSEPEPASPETTSVRDSNTEAETPVEPASETVVAEEQPKTHRIDAAEAGTPPVARMPEHIVKVLMAADALLQARHREAATQLLKVAVEVSGGDPRVQKRLDALNRDG